jgi:SAM-dependent methyltransferase
LTGVAVARAKEEAEQRGLDIVFTVADMRQLYAHHARQFDVVISADNSVPHLLTDDDILQAFQQFFKCTRPGGGVIITVRDYDAETRHGSQLKPYGVRVAAGKRYVVFQVWEFKGDIYDVAMYFIEDDGLNECVTHVMRSKYYAVGTTRLIHLLEQAGYNQVTRLDGVYFQPIIIGTKIMDN